MGKGEAWHRGSVSGPKLFLLNEICFPFDDASPICDGSAGHWKPIGFFSLSPGASASCSPVLVTTQVLADPVSLALLPAPSHTLGEEQTLLSPFLRHWRWLCSSMHQALGEQQHQPYGHLLKKHSSCITKELIFQQALKFVCNFSLLHQVVWFTP